MGFPCGSAGKESACNAGDLGLMKGIPLYPWRRKWSSVVVQLVKNLPETQETQFDFWVGKIPWRREYSSILGLLWWLRW